MFVCLSVCTYVCTYVFMYVCVYVMSMYVCITYVCMYVSTYVCMYVCMYSGVQMQNDDTGGARGTYRGEDKYVQNFGRETRRWETLLGYNPDFSLDRPASAQSPCLV